MNATSLEDIVSYLSGDARPEDAQRVERAIAAGGETARRAAEVGELIATMRGDDTTEPPADLLARVVAAFVAPGAPAAPAGPAWLEGARRWIATLAFDSRAQPAIAGFRGSGDQRLLSYESEAGWLDLQVAAPVDPATGRCRLHGQLDAVTGIQVGSVTLLPSASSGRSGPPTDATRVDDHGAFQLEPRPGRYDLVVEIDGGATALVVPDLDLRSR